MLFFFISFDFTFLSLVGLFFILQARCQCSQYIFFYSSVGLVQSFYLCMYVLHEETMIMIMALKENAIVLVLKMSSSSFSRTVS